jgi:ABC-type nitrate/sulfonate/bicarbonate transport system permease component
MTFKNTDYNFTRQNDTYQNIIVNDNFILTNPQRVFYAFVADLMENKTVVKDKYTTLEIINIYFILGCFVGVFLLFFKSTVIIGLTIIALVIISTILWYNYYNKTKIVEEFHV